MARLALTEAPVLMRICGKRCDTGDVVTLTTGGGRITRCETGELNRDIGGPELFVAPGFIDIQLNGYGGHDFNFGAWGEASEISNNLEPIFEAAAKAGASQICPTVTTNSREQMIAALSAIAKTLDSTPRLSRATAGIHVEGPYIASEDGPRGAHPLEHVRDPDWDEFLHFQAAAGGRIKLLTLAPERAGAIGFIEKAASSGVAVAIGHTGADPEAIREAVYAGARLSTHLGNGAHAYIRRHPNYIWEQLASDELYASIITDGHHLPPSVVKSIARVKGPDRLILVSDAVSLGGLMPGLYGDGRFEVLPSGKVVLAGSPYLAGAGHLLDTCVANAVRYSDLSLAQAVHCASAVPARLFGADRQKGRLQVGCDADLVLFRMPESGPLQIDTTICCGEIIYRA